jgi:haloalkane dehalogenase
MHRTRWSFFYLIGYLSLAGGGLLVAPKLALPLLGATASYPPVLARFVGAFMVTLAIVVGQIVRHRVEVLYPTTLIVRVVLLSTIVGLYFESRDRLFLVLAGIVAFGMLLTIAGFLSDRRANANGRSDEPSGSAGMTLPFPVSPGLFPVAHRFLDIDGARIHYIDEGSGETLLLLHGNPTWSFLYRKIIAALKDQCRCVALDYPGYGMSNAPPGYGFTPREHSAVLERFVDRLGLTDLTIMVQDWGGPVGFGFAGRRPELVRRFIIGNTFAWPLDDEPRIRVFSWVMGGPIGWAFTRGFNFVPRFFFSRGFGRRIPREVLDLYLAPWRDPARRKAAVIAPRQLIAASSFLKEVELGLPKLADRAALIVWGTEDFAFREAERQRFEQAFPRHKTILFEDASHFLQEDVGDRIAEAFKAFRNEVG